MLITMTFSKTECWFFVCLFSLCGAKASATDFSPDVDHYYKAGFTADKVPQSVVSTIDTLDNHPLPFTEVDYKQSGDVRLQDGRHLSVDAYVSVIPQRGAIVTIVSREDSKENYASVQFELSYRGLLVLRDQKYFPNIPVATKQFQKLPPDHSPIMAVNSLSLDAGAFPVGLGRRAVFDFEVAPVDESSHPIKMQRVCQFDDEFDASTIAPELSGRAVRVACDLFDETGKSRDLHQDKIYLKDYGVALLSKVITSKFAVDYKISELHVTH